MLTYNSKRFCSLYILLWLIHFNRRPKSKQVKGKTSYYSKDTQSTGQLSNPWMKSRRKKPGLGPSAAPMGLENKQQMPDCTSTLLLSLPPCSHSQNGTNKMMNVILQWPLLRRNSMANTPTPFIPNPFSSKESLWRFITFSPEGKRVFPM